MCACICFFCSHVVSGTANVYRNWLSVWGCWWPWLLGYFCSFPSLSFLFFVHIKPRWLWCFSHFEVVSIAESLLRKIFDFVFCFGGFSVPSFDPYVFPLYDQHILRIYLHCTLYKFFLYTPLCERGVFMHFWFPLHGMLIYQYTSYSGLPSYWFSSCLLLFSPLTCMGFMGYLAVLFLPPSGLETVYFCLLRVGWDQHCSFVSDVLFWEYGGLVWGLSVQML